MNIKGPITIIIEGSRGSGKSQISELLLDELAEYGVDVVLFSEGAEPIDCGQKITIIERQVKQ